MERLVGHAERFNVHFFVADHWARFTASFQPFCAEEIRGWFTASVALVGVLGAIHLGSSSIIRVLSLGGWRAAFKDSRAFIHKRRHSRRKTSVPRPASQDAALQESTTRSFVALSDTARNFRQLVADGPTRALVPLT